jgi:hypothetical protein
MRTVFSCSVDAVFDMVGYGSERKNGPGWKSPGDDWI